jgi:hypothetical protein
LRKITPDQFDSIEERAAIKGKKELLKQQSKNNLRTVDVDGKTIEAESIDAEKAYSNKNNVTTAGYANDSLSYAMALDIAQTQAELQGEDLSVEAFAERGVERSLTTPSTEAAITFRARPSEIDLAISNGEIPFS